MIDLRPYRFSIIYSVDVDAKTRLANYRPPNFQRLHWEVTESNPSELDDVFGKGGKHRKYCNILDYPQFLEFLDHCGLTAERVHTMGSLGAPGFGIYHSPAVCFDSEDADAYQNAYVTPIPPQLWREMTGQKDPQENLPGLPEDISTHDWDAVEQAMWNWFDEGEWSAKRHEEQLEKTELAEVH